jgi:pimeloyl-ACP methyl ester carboxylesterase
VRPTRPSLALRATLFLLALSTPLSGCYFVRSPIRPIPALQFQRSEAGRSRCLVVMFPGFLDGPDTFQEHGFPRDVAHAGGECDSVAVDLHLRYYQEVGVGQMVHDDILLPASARGYQEIWLVGISMGGLGALLTAEAHPEMVAGIILLAPFVGEESVVREIEAAGGARRWHPPAGIEEAVWTRDNYTQHLWAWLRGYATDEDAMPPLYMGWGDDDQLGPGDRLLAAMQPDDHVVTQPGNHSWTTWRPIFDELLARAHPGR